MVKQSRDLVTWLMSNAAGECCRGSSRAMTLSPGSRALLQVSDAEGPAGPWPHHLAREHCYRLVMLRAKQGHDLVTWLKIIFGEAAEGQDTLEIAYYIQN
jgi:hypothetical protein